MKIDFKARIAIIGAAGAMLALMATTAAAQDGDGNPRRQVPAGKTPRAADGKPDLSGVWSPEHTFIYDISVSLDERRDASIAALGGKIDQRTYVEGRSGGQLHADRRAAPGAVSMADHAKPGPHRVSL